MKAIILILILQSVSVTAVQATENGRWVLTISGADKLEFGTQSLAGGLNIKWTARLDMTIENGQFKQGSGTARLSSEISPFSRPAGMFDCKLTKGTFSNRNGLSFYTPHLRYKSFPVAGKIEGNSIQINSLLEYPGNYYAVLYQCETSHESGSIWIERSPRLAGELSKRQNTITQYVDGIYRARVKEVKSISPGPQIELPLIDGLKFSVTRQYGLRKLEYRLNRITQD